ncbi:dephospho-CoA kinase [Niabella soli]|uniref:Dephospho-CoA kinase n=1 Tax=Niabella soli DSM 19437 TaxID=929713 RepID=W0EYZ5_9BACT|nr:dephospho-CoA kinase [Niabella soli]AHF14419.1 dephospho-CoA kinase [Niabella soli DSM 19437]
MLKVGITGGIGSGKTLVASLFKTLGIPVYDADAAAKQLMNTDTAIHNQIIKMFGEAAYVSGELDRAYIAAQIFGDDTRRQLLNSIVHPATIRHSEAWFQKQKAPYSIKEAAILFESGSDQFVDYVIGVTAAETLRIRRTMERSHLSEAQVRERMSKQMDEGEKMALCDFVIDNNGGVSLIEQVLNVHTALLERAGGK